MARSGITVNIYQTVNGYVVTAGCMTLVFEKSEILLSELARWMANPGEIETEYVKRYGGPAPTLERDSYQAMGMAGVASGFATAEDRERLHGLDPARVYPSKT